MKILSQLIQGVEVATKEPGCGEPEIKKLSAFSPVPVPDDYLAFVREATEAELQINFNDGNFWFLRIWGPESCIDMNEGYHVQEWLPDSLAIGDDEGCGMLVWLPKASRPGLYHVRMSYIDMDGARFLASSLIDLLGDINKLKNVFAPELPDAVGS